MIVIAQTLPKAREWFRHTQSTENHVALTSIKSIDTGMRGRMKKDGEAVYVVGEFTDDEIELIHRVFMPSGFKLEDFVHVDG